MKKKEICKRIENIEEYLLNVIDRLDKIQNKDTFNLDESENTSLSAPKDDLKIIKGE